MMNSSHEQRDATLPVTIVSKTDGFACIFTNYMFYNKIAEGWKNGDDDGINTKLDYIIDYGCLLSDIGVEMRIKRRL